MFLVLTPKVFILGVVVFS